MIEQNEKNQYIVTYIFLIIQRNNMFAFVSLLVCLLTLMVVYLWTLNSRYSYFKQRNIPTPSFQFFFGHYKTLWSNLEITRQLQRWTRQYGSVYGLYEGSRQVYVVSNVDFLQEVYIKRFSSFHSRRLPFILRHAPGSSPHLFACTGETWHRQRRVINPAFSSAKLKLMVPMVDESVESLMKKLGEHCEEKQEVNIYLLYKRLTMDVICKYSAEVKFIGDCLNVDQRSMCFWSGDRHAK
jgi:hypothetical protein